MTVKCPQCGREYAVIKARIPGDGTVARCSGCGSRFRVEPPQGREELTCPKCGTRQALGDECIRCGVVFGKVLDQGDSAMSAGSPEGGAGLGGQSAQVMMKDGPSRDGPSPGYGGERAFSVGSALKFGWAKARENLVAFIGFLILGVLFLLLPDYMADMADERGPAITRILFRAVAIVLETAVSMGFIKASLRVHDGEPPQLTNLLDCLPLFFRYFFSSLLYAIVVLGGLILLVVPGIIWSIKFCFYGYFIVDQGQGPVQALKSSARITAGAKMDVFLMGMALAVINALGLLALLVGLFVTLPLSMVAFAYAFRRLSALRPSS